MSQQGPQYNQQYNPQQPPPGWQPPAPPKKKHTARNVLIVLAVLAVVGIGGCFAVVGSIGNELDKQSNETHDVVYTVSGKGSAAADLTYTTDGSTTTEQVQGAKLPWKKQLTIKGGLIAIYQLSAQNQGQGSVSCSITVDGKPVKSATATGFAAIASCNYTP
jgi:hypothetical protein